MMMGQLSLFADEVITIEKKPQKGIPIDILPFEEYDHILVSLSGGKDSMACLFYLQNNGVDMTKVELVHQCVDGGPMEDDPFMDWACTESYVKAVGELFGIRTYFQWREGGIKGEMLRQNATSKGIYYLDEGNLVYLPTKQEERYKNTRLKWPMMGADLRTRYCSSNVKIDVFGKVLRNHPRYQGTKENPKRILVLTGERREESPNRAKYNKAELHKSSAKQRIVHAYRPVIDFKEREIWDEYEKRKFLPHPAYLCGWSRTSCFSCIFSSSDLWAMCREIAPERFRKLVEMEKYLNHTIDPKMSLTEKATLGSLKRMPKDPRLSTWIEMALNNGITKDDLIKESWSLPAGAFGGYEGGSF